MQTPTKRNKQIHCSVCTLQNHAREPKKSGTKYSNSNELFATGKSHRILRRMEEESGKPKAKESTLHES